MKNNLTRIFPTSTPILFLLIILLIVLVFGTNPAQAESPGMDNIDQVTRPDQSIDPCDLMPPEGDISSQSEITCVAQFSSTPAEKVVQIQSNLVGVDNDQLCSGLLEPSDFHIMMKEAKFGDCGIQSEVSYQGTPMPGYTGWNVRYYYRGISVRVATSQAYPANQSWVYETAEEIEGIIDQTLGGTTSSDPSEDLPSDNRAGERKSEEECAQMHQEVADMAERAPDSTVADIKLGIIAEVLSAPGSGPAIHDYCGGGEGTLSDGSLIKIGDCIKNGKEVMIEIKDQETDDSGGTYIILSEDSEVCFDEFFITVNPVRYDTVAKLVSGALHVITSGWKNGSIFTVKAGTTISGIRGSDVFIQYDPDFDFVQTLVIEGHVDVTSEATGETVSLSDNQGVVIVEGDIMDIAHISQDLWDSYLEEFGMRVADFPELENEENTPEALDLEEIQEMLERADPAGDDEGDRNQTILFFLIGSFFCCGTVLVIGAVILILVFQAKKKKEQGD